MLAVFKSKNTLLAIHEVESCGKFLLAANVREEMVLVLCYYLNRA